MTNRSPVPYNIKLKNRARELRKNQTKAEQCIWEQLLRKNKSGYRFLRQKPLDQFIVDFYCSELQLVVEIDGDIHKEQKEYDYHRTLILKSFGLTILRFSNNEVLEDLESVETRLEREIKLILK